MTDENTQNNTSDNNAATQEKKPSNKIIMGFIAVALAYSLITSLFSSNDKAETGDAPTILDEQKQGKFAEADLKNQEDNPLGISGPINNEAIITLNKRLRSLKNKHNNLLIETRKKEIENKKIMAQFRNEFNAEMGKLTALIEKIALGRTASFQKGLGAEDVPLLSFDEQDNDNLPEEESLPFGKKHTVKDFDYRTPLLGKNPVANLGETPPPSPSPDKTEETPPFGISLDSPPINLNETKSSGKNKKSNKKTNRTEQDKNKKVLVEKVIGNGAYVRARLLHGVDCPIGGGIGKGASGLLSKSPVVLPLTSSFKVNGRTFNVPNASFAGVCFGLRSTERAIFKFEGLSYYDENDEHQIAKTNAHVADAKDNSSGVKGTLISTRASDMAKTSTAAGLAAFASSLSSNQYTQTTNFSNGTTSKVLTGNGVRAAGLSMFGDALGQLSKMALEDAKASVDVIYIPANTEVIIYLDTPMSVFLGKEEDISNEDELI